MLTGKVALVTGASRGIGRQTAITLASYGAKVIVNYNGNKEKAEQVVAEIVQNGGEAVTYCCNVSDYNAVEGMMKDIVKEFGALHILVNNAAVQYPQNDITRNYERWSFDEDVRRRL